MTQVVLLSQSGEVSALMHLALEGDERFDVAGVASDVAGACALVKALGAEALIFDSQGLDLGSGEVSAELQAALPGVALLAYAPGQSRVHRRFVRDADEIQWAETALSVGNSLAMMLQANAPALADLERSPLQN